MIRRHTPVPFTSIFTTADLNAVGLSRGVLVTWLRHGEVGEIADGVFAPSHLEISDDVKRIWRDRETALGHKPVSAAGAAVIHELWTPPRIPQFLYTTNRKVPLSTDCVERRGRLQIPTVAWTALQLTRGQDLPGALVPLDSALRLGVPLRVLESLAERMQGWSGTRALHAALAAASALSGSPLESFSRGVMLVHAVPTPTLQHEFRIQGRRYFTDFAWASANTVGEADGEDKYKREGAIAAEKRRQGALHSVGIQVLRWGWPEVLNHPEHWATGLKRALDIQRSGVA